jgi:phi LC3 family holin
MKINWKIRLLGKTFWVTIIPAVLLLAQAILAIFGVEVDFTPMQGKLLAAVDALFVVLVILGITNDPTTPGVSDSALALAKETPINFTVEDAKEMLDVKVGGTDD